MAEKQNIATQRQTNMFRFEFERLIQITLYLFLHAVRPSGLSTHMIKSYKYEVLIHTHLLQKRVLYILRV